ncbi:STARP-like antigen [Echinococcus multilocularis]|uniref:STARP-like antigen n=1 Tax=Echinococcus multilocularis TaxID=6211 RepID=A0A087W2L6_ECHMU|nr:STARP-like antigen [Echinococcus multilocularis]
MPLQQQGQERPPLQPVYVIPLSGAAAPVEPIAVGPSNTRAITQTSVPSIAPKIDSPSASSQEMGKKRQPLFPLDDREMKRRVVKQYMERRRRACISDKLSALHSLAVSLVGETPQQQSHQRIEITDILNQCVSVLQSLSEFVKNEPELQAKMHRLKLPSVKESSEEQRRRRQGETTSKEVMKEEAVEVEKENVMPHASAFTPVGRHRMVTASTPLEAPPLSSPPPCLQYESLSMTRKRKRESTDSGLNSLASPSTGANSTSSFTSPTPSTSAYSSSRLEETQPLKRSRKPSSFDIWRPYRD